jgi:hypothetical protein
MSVVSVVCCQVEVSASDRSFVQRSPTECGVSEYDREASILRMPGPTGGRCAKEIKKKSVSPPSKHTAYCITKTTLAITLSLSVPLRRWGEVQVRLHLF